MRSDVLSGKDIEQVRRYDVRIAYLGGVLSALLGVAVEYGGK